MACPGRQAGGTGQRGSNEWLQAVLAMYPDLLTTTHCVPPVHFSRLPYTLHTVAGQRVLVQQPPVTGGQPGSGGSSATSGSGQSKLSHVEVNCLPLRVQDRPEQKGKKKCKLRFQKKKKKREAEQVLRPMWSAVPPPPENTTATATATSSITTSPVVSVYDSDLRDDFAQQHVLLHLQELAHTRSEVMFILSQLRFSDYLSQPSYAAAVEAAKLPMPGDLGTRYRSGEFDILVIHRHFGILIGEVKSVGIQQAGFVQSLAEADNDVAKRVKRAVRQLDRSEKVVNHLVSDMVPGLKLGVRKTIFLPYVSQAQLERVLAADCKLLKEVCQSLGATDSRGRLNRAKAVELCVCSEQLSDPRRYWHVTPDVMSDFEAWWQRRMSPTNTQLTDTYYLEIVSRFVGPASSKNVHCVFSPPREVKALWQAISELGRRLVRLVLSPKQIDLMIQAPSRLCLTGPPGTGKASC